MKLYITLESGDKKVERLLEVSWDSLTYHNKYGEIIEEMSDSLRKEIEQEMMNEAQRLTQHTD